MEHLTKLMKKALFNDHSPQIKYGWGELYEKYKSHIDINGRMLYSLISVEDRNIIGLIKLQKRDKDGITKSFCCPSKMSI